MPKTKEIAVVSTSTQVIDYPVTDKAIADLRAQYKDLVVTNNSEWKAVSSALSVVRGLRVSVEKRRKELKADALEYGRKVDAEAKRITTLIEEIEDPLAAQKQAYEEEKERIRQEKEQIERDRVANIVKRINTIREYPLKLVGKTSDDIRKAITECSASLDDGFDYQEFGDDAIAYKKESIEKMESLLREREEVEAAKAAELVRHKEMEEARIKLEQEQKELKAAQDALAAERAAQERLALEAQERAEAEYQLAEAKKRAEEAERQAEIERERAEIERQKRELAQQQAAHDAEVRAKAELEAKEKADLEAAAKAEAALKAKKKAEKEESATQRLRDHAQDMLNTLSKIASLAYDGDLGGYLVSETNMDVVRSVIKSARG